MRTIVRVALVASLVLVGSAVRAQDAAKPAEVAKFIGTWALTLDGPQGSFTMNLSLTEKEGRVSAELTSDIAPPQPVEDITTAGEDLVLKYAGNYQGNAFDAKITLTPDGDKSAKVVFDVMNGQFMMNGSGAKK